MNQHAAHGLTHKAHAAAAGRAPARPAVGALGRGV